MFCRWFCQSQGWCTQVNRRKGKLLLPVLICQTNFFTTKTYLWVYGNTSLVHILESSIKKSCIFGLWSSGSKEVWGYNVNLVTEIIVQEVYESLYVYTCILTFQKTSQWTVYRWPISWVMWLRNPNLYEDKLPGSLE